MNKFLGRSSLKFLTPWHASILNAKPSISKNINGMKLIKPQHSFLINKNIEKTKK